MYLRSIDFSVTSAWGKRERWDEGNKGNISGICIYLTYLTEGNIEDLNWQ